MKQRLNYTILLALFTCLQLSAQRNSERPELAGETIYLSIGDAVSYAQEYAYRMQLADQDVLKARKRVWESISTGLPQISGSANYQYNILQQQMALPGDMMGMPGQTVNIKVGTAHSFNAGVSLSQMVFDGSYIVGLKAAKTYQDITRLAKEKTSQAISEAVTNAYWTVLTAEQSMALAEKNLFNQRLNLEQIIESYKQGLVAEEDAEQLSLLVSNLETEYERAGRNVEISKDMLKYMTGLDLETAVVLTDKIDNLITGSLYLMYIGEDFDKTRNIDYQIAENTVKSQQQLFKLQKTYSMPSLFAFGNFNTNSYFLGGEGNWFNTSAVGLSLNVPIFSSLGRAAKTAQAKIDYEKSKISMTELEQKLLLDVRSAKSEYEYAVKQYVTQKDNVELAQTILNKEQIKYNEGLSTSFRVTELTNQLIQSQGLYLNSILGLINAKTTIEQLYGEIRKN